MLTLRRVMIIIMLSFMALQAKMFGVNDLLSLFLIMISTVVMYLAVIKLQIGNKQVLRVNAREGGWLHGFLSKEKTVFIRFMSFVVSMSFSFIFVLILKGIVINHGMISVFIIIGVVSFTIFSFINKEKTDSELVKDNLHFDLASHANNMLYIILISSILNIALSFILSAHDTMELLNHDINFANFDKYAINDAIKKTDSNTYTRLLANFYILLDSIKLAAATKVISIILPNMEDKENWFYLFYIVIFIMNMVKLFAFSLSFVLLQKGFEGWAQNIMVYFNKALTKSPVIKEWIINIKSKFSKKT